MFPAQDQEAPSLEPRPTERPGSAAAGRPPRRKRVTYARWRVPGVLPAVVPPAGPAPRAVGIPPCAPVAPPVLAAPPALLPMGAGGRVQAAALVGILALALALAGLLYADAQRRSAGTAPPPGVAAQATLAAITGGYQTALAATPRPAQGAAEATNAAITAGYQTRVAGTADPAVAGPQATTATIAAAYQTRLAGVAAPVALPTASLAAARPPVAALPAGSSTAHPAPTGAVAAPVRRLVARAVPAAIVGDGMTLGDPALDADPGAILLTTPNLTAGSAPGAAHDHALGVYRTGGQWLIYNQDRLPMAAGAAFNVVALPPGPDATVHIAGAANIVGDATTLDIPLANGHPDAVVLVGANWNPPGSDGVYNDHPVGVAYAGGRWHIFNEDHAAMPAGAAFDVLVRPPGAATFVARASAAPPDRSAVVLDNALVNGRPDAILIVTPNRTPPGAPDIYHGHNLGAAYAGGRWRLVNADGAPVAAGAAFNVGIWLP